MRYEIGDTVYIKAQIKDAEPHHGIYYVDYNGKPWVPVTDERLVYANDLIKQGANKVVDKVLEIIDKHGTNLIGDIIDAKFPEKVIAYVLASIRVEVLTLKDGDL